MVDQSVFPDVGTLLKSMIGILALRFFESDATNLSMGSSPTKCPTISETGPSCYLSFLISSWVHVDVWRPAYASDSCSELEFITGISRCWVYETSVTGRRNK